MQQCLLASLRYLTWHQVKSETKQSRQRIHYNKADLDLTVFAFDWSRSQSHVGGLYNQEEESDCHIITTIRKSTEKHFNQRVQKPWLTNLSTSPLLQGATTNTANYLQFSLRIHGRESNPGSKGILQCNKVVVYISLNDAWHRKHKWQGLSYPFMSIDLFLCEPPTVWEQVCVGVCVCMAEQCIIIHGS